MLESWKIKYLTFISVVECTFDACATGTCGGEERLCAQTCLNGVFGVNVECPFEQAEKTGVCPDLPCGMFWLLIFI